MTKRYGNKDFWNGKCLGSLRLAVDASCPAYTGLPLSDMSVSSGLTRRMTERFSGVVMSNLGVMAGVAKGPTTLPLPRAPVAAAGVSMSRLRTVRLRVERRTVPVSVREDEAPPLCAGVLPTPRAAERGALFLAEGMFFLAASTAREICWDTSSRSLSTQSPPAAEEEEESAPPTSARYAAALSGSYL